MRGLLHHLAITLRLNFRSKQAIIYGYVVPIFFLFAFGAVFRAPKPMVPLVREMGQLLTVTILGGACFGMPTAMVAERERGVWRRYRLLPAAIGGIILSAMVARFILVLSAGLLQIGLAHYLPLFGTTWPAHPWQMLVAFTVVSFAFLGVGLVIAMVADGVPAVQALGQAVFLPMIMIGGVGVPLERLPKWAQHVAGFLPGRYAVQAMQACMRGTGLAAARFDLLALTVIGLAGVLAGAKLFRWDVGRRVAGPAAKAWVVLAIVAWFGVGLAAERTGRQVVASAGESPAGVAIVGATTQAATSTTSTAPSAAPPVAAAATEPAAPWEAVTKAQIDKIEYDDVPDDDGTVVPLAANLDNADDEQKKRLDGIVEKIESWKPAQEPDLAQRVRSLLCVPSVADVVQDQQEAEIPFVVFEKMKADIPKDKLTKAVAWVILNPDEGAVVTSLSDLGIDGDVPESNVRERVTLYGKKLLYRLLGKPVKPR